MSTHRRVVAIAAVVAALLRRLRLRRDHHPPTPRPRPRPRHQARTSQPSADDDGTQVRQLRADPGRRRTARRARDPRSAGGWSSASPPTPSCSPRATPENGDIEGFDIDFAFEVADEICGPRHGRRSWSGNGSCSSVITAATSASISSRTSAVDIVVRNTTINCERWQRVAFSAEYYPAGQKVLVGRDRSRRPGLSRRRFARARPTCGQAHLRAGGHHEHREHPEDPAGGNPGQLHRQLGLHGALPERRGRRRQHRRHRLAGLAAQDPYAEVIKTDLLTKEPYGIAINSDNDDLVRFINQRARGDARATAAGRRSTTSGCETSCNVPGKQPKPVYGR